MYINLRLRRVLIVLGELLLFPRFLSSSRSRTCSALHADTNMTKRDLVLTFGDSLTSGYTNQGMLFHPYSIKLSALLSEQNITCVVECGMSGETTAHMVPRLAELLEEGSRSGKQFRIVSILGGTNDLGGSDDIFGNLLRMYMKAFEHNARYVVAITIPESLFTNSKYVNRRNMTNQQIRQYCQDNERCLLLDLEEKIPYFAERNSEKGVNESLWNDPLHMQPLGYDMFGSYVFDLIKDKLEV